MKLDKEALPDLEETDCYTAPFSRARMHQWASFASLRLCKCPIILLLCPFWWSPWGLIKSRHKLSLYTLCNSHTSCTAMGFSREYLKCHKFDMFTTLSAFKAHSYIGLKWKLPKSILFPFTRKWPALYAESVLTSLLWCFRSVQVTLFIPDFKSCHPNAWGSPGQWVESVA